MELSVVIPTHNGESRIANSLSSLKRQSLDPKRFEVIVVDNASVDRTSDVVREYMSTMDNLRLVMEPRKNRAIARNSGIAASQGDFVLFLDDDITIAPDNLNIHLSIHSAATVPTAVVGLVRDESMATPWWLHDYLEAKQCGGTRAYPGKSVEIPGGLFFVTQNASVSRRCLDSVAVRRGNHLEYFDPRLTMRQDGDLGIRMTRSGVAIATPAELISSHHHPRNWGTIASRSYDSGYVLPYFVQKNPEARAANRYLTHSKSLRLGLLIAAQCLFAVGIALSPLTRKPLRKAVGGLILHDINRGYQQALSDAQRLPT
jgi:glycosyltransferase involved in cell wall biosynthesis